MKPNTPFNEFPQLLILSGRMREQSQSVGVQLLTDVRDLFERRGTDRLASEDIAEHLAGMEERTWPEWGRSKKAITKTGLAKMLGKFDIRPATIRIGTGTAKGYMADQFCDAWERYCGNVTTVTRQY